MSCSRTTDYLTNASQRVYTLEQQLLSWRKVLRDFLECPVFVDLKSVVTAGPNTTVTWFNEAGRGYDIHESFDGIAWFPAVQNLIGDSWTTVTTALYFRIVRRPYEVVSCTLVHDAEVPDVRFLAEVIGLSGGCYDAVRDELSCESDET